MSTARKILVVDDDAIVRKSFDRVLSGKGYAVITASSGEEALLKLADGTYDAVFADIAMQGMSGLDVAEQIRARQPWLPVVIITGYGSGAAQARAEAAGVSEFLHKPLSPEQLAGTADRVLRTKDSVTTVQPEATAAAKVSPAPDVITPASRLKNIALFLLAPFVGLGYILAFPVVGLGMLAWMAMQAQKKKSEAAAGLQPTAPVKSSVLKTIALMLAVPFIGLAFVIAGPIVGLGMLAWFGFQAWSKLGAKALAASPDIK